MVDSSRRVVLICYECGEKVVLGGPESVWRSARTFFECECGQLLTLADREDETLIRGERLVNLTAPASARVYPEIEITREPDDGNPKVSGEEMLEGRLRGT